ncbi:MAG: hypothetical protein K6U04_14905 [Armatimonadetes bacterium]|nr:hypothetical protein [Armatimonadota bacterium]
MPGFKVRGGALAISTLLGVFICLLVVSALRGLDVECGCFSGAERRVGWLAIAEDLAMLAGGLRRVTSHFCRLGYGFSHFPAHFHGIKPFSHLSHHLHSHSGHFLHQFHGVHSTHHTHLFFH